MTPTRSYDVIISGAGIIGASIAWHASQKRLRVAIIDASGPAAGASGASDGAVSVASKKPGLMAGLAGRSLTYCKALAGKGQVLEGTFLLRPSFLFGASQLEYDALDRLVHMLEDQSLPVSLKQDGKASQSSVAGLGPDIGRVIELTGEGHMLGYEAVHAYLSASPVDRYFPCKLEAFDATGDHVRIQTSLGEMTAGKLVIATGMGTAALFPDLPLLPRSGQLLITDRTTGPDWRDIPGPLTSAAYLLDKSEGHRILPQAPVVIDPLGTGQLLIGSSREDNGTAAQTDFKTVKNIMKSAVNCLPALANRRVIRVFAGVRTATRDGLPIVGALPALPNVILATGFEGDGICLSAIVGREVAETLCGNGPDPEFAALSPARFDRPEAVAR